MPSSLLGSSERVSYREPPSGGDRAEVTEKALRGEQITFDVRKHMLNVAQTSIDVAHAMCQKVLAA